MAKIYFNDWSHKYRPQMDEEEIGFLKMYSLDTLPKDTDKHLIWTELSDMNGTVLPGLRLVDSLCYYITAKPWADEDFHTLEVTELITREDYLAEIEYYRDDADDETVALLEEQMNEEFPENES